MCGVAGFTRFGQEFDEPGELLGRMGQSIRHRGPDDAAMFIDPQVGLCHQRLSIIDLSASGRQPMHSASDRYVIVYNGEIYNFESLREQLQRQGVVFRGNSDTEVLLELFARKGADCLAELNGMFAIAIWDKREKSLFLARDRLGKKPLYYYSHRGRFLFASEIKAILCASNIDSAIRPDAVQDYFFYQYVPDPKSIFTHIQKLPPGCWMRVSADGVEQHQYWDVSFASPQSRTAEQIQEELYELLDDSVRIRMISDVPLGAFLSGGVDSSAVVGLMAANSEKPVTTCAIGFGVAEFDEVAEAASVARQFNTDHHEFTVRETVANNLSNIASYFDEPFADPSFVPTYFVSQLARQAVTVALAGDGGDENFAGYSKYLNDRRENQLRAVVPGFLSQQLFAGMSRKLGGSNFGLLRRGGSLLHSLSLDPAEGFYLSNSFFNSLIWQAITTEGFKRELQCYDSAEITKQHYNAADTDDHLSRILYTDIKSYLAGDILVKVDRMGMANSLETRAPILDYRVVEYAASIPSSLKIHRGETKYILKKTMSSLLTQDTLYRKKMGFSVPLASWLRYELAEQTQAALLATNSGLSNYFKPAAVKQLWQQHRSGDRDYSQELWSLLMFELWWQRYVQ